MPVLITVPDLGSAEKNVKVARWLAVEGARVRRGDPVVAVETLKAAFEIEAPADGILYLTIAREGARVALAGVLAVVVEEGEKPSEAEIAALVASVAAVKGPADFPTTSASAPAPVRAAAAAASTSAAPSGDGTLDREFLQYLRKNGAAFAELSSEFQISILRKYGANIGNSVVFGARALVVADKINIGSGVHIGAGCVVDAGELHLGNLTNLGARTRVRCRVLRTGENAYMAPDVEIGGGGAMDPEAECHIGSHGFIGEHVHINCCRPVHIGHEVILSRSAVIMTHSFGGSVLKGYPNRFAGVRIGDGCQIGIQTTIFPGVEVGAGSILLSNSSLVTNVPAGRMFGGVPARDMKAAAEPPRDLQQLEIAREIVLEFGRQMQLRGHDARMETSRDSVELIITKGRARHRLYFSEKLNLNDAELAAEDLRVGMRATAEELASLPPDLAAMDLGNEQIRGVLGPLAGAFREFLRKRGVRLHPRSWTYTGGWL